MLQLLKNIWLILSLDCQGSAELTSESFDRKLHWSEKTAVWFHCLICKKSNKLTKQLTCLNSKLDQMLETQNDTPLSLSREARARIAKQIKAAGNDLD